MKLKTNFNKQTIQPTPNIETTDSENNNIRKPMMILTYAGLVRKLAFSLNP